LFFVCGWGGWGGGGGGVGGVLCFFFFFFFFFLAIVIPIFLDFSRCLCMSSGIDINMWTRIHCLI